MKSLGNLYDATPAQIAIAWALAKKTVPIIGVTKKNHVMDIASAVNIDLSGEEIALLEKTASKINIDVKAGWEPKM